MATSALEILLKRLAMERAAPLPEPAQPVGLGPLSGDTSAAFGAQNPEPVPPSFVQPAAPDTSFVNQYAGAAPVAPTIQQPGTLDKLAAILSGVAYGPAAAEQIRAERQEPIRRFERDTAQYQDRRSRGLELAERRAEREAAQANRQNELLYESEYKKWLAKNNDRSDEAKLRMQQAFQLERDARAARLEAEKELQRERRQREDDARSIAGRLGTGPGAAPPAIAKELGRYYANLTESLSPAAAKWQNAQARRAEMLASRGGTGGGGGSSSTVENTLAEFETLKQMAIQGVKSAGGTPQDEIDAVRRATSGVVRKMARQPRLFEVGTGQFGFPYAKPRGGATAPAPAQSGGKDDPLGIR